MIFPVQSVIMPESFGCGVVRDLCGHGIGTHMHEDPETQITANSAGALS